MSQSTLTWLRFVTPGILVLLFIGILGAVTGLWPMWQPGDWKDTSYSISVIIPAGIYYLTPVRDRMNRYFFRKISKNIRDRLVQISELPDLPDVYTWKALRGIFYHFIDNDKSLSAKASLAYFNGYVWTTLADIRALSYPFALVACALWYFGFDGAPIALMAFILLTIFSYFGSTVVTEQQIDIGDQQLEIIEHKYKSELTRMMEAVHDRANRGRNNPNASGV